MAFSGWHARFFSSMECRRGHAGRGYSADRVSPGLSMLTLRVSMAPVPIPGAKPFGSREVESAHRLADAADLGSSGSGLLNRRPLRPQDRRRGEKSAQSLLFPTTRPFSTCETLVLYRLFRAVVS